MPARKNGHPPDASPLTAAHVLDYPPSQRAASSTKSARFAFARTAQLMMRG